MAASLIESLGAEFDPSDFHDEYRDAVAEMIERKRTTGETRPAPVAEQPTDEGDSMTDLLTALQRSVEAAKASQKEPAKEPDEKDSDDTPKEKPATRKRASKKDDTDDKPARRRKAV